MCGIINRLVTWKLFGPEGGTRQLHHKDIKMIEHLRKYIGLYLTAMCLPFALGYILSEDHPVWVWWLILILVVWKTPPYSLSDRFWGGYMRLLDWALKPLINAPIVFLYTLQNPLFFKLFFSIKLHFQHNILC